MLGFAAFFALVLKKVEHEDEENMAIDGPLSASGTCLINTTDLGLQSNFRLLLNWILHHFHDVCGAESLHFSDSGCFQ